ncbi:MAG: methyltransferase domain-containing protein [Candidatus Heimdallarchaeota archaeon]|nr:methyltransferase domain-containing protein [Candidatus Heimdallarchaeota archaeon]
MSNKDLVEEQFGREAEKYAISKIHTDHSDFVFILKFIKPLSHWKVLDIATGTGNLAFALAPHVKEIHATDITSEMLNQVKKRKEKELVDNISTLQVNVHQIPFDDDTFDLTTSRIAPHHFYDISLAIEEMVRVTRVGGYIFIQDTLSPEDQDSAIYLNKIEKLRDPSHIWDLSPSQWVEKFRENECELEYKHITKKVWKIREWLDRMSTPKENERKIRELLDGYDLYKPHLDFKKEDDWVLQPDSGYFLFRKR